MSKYERMGRQELAQYMVTHRNTPEGEEARHVYIRRLTAKAQGEGVDIKRGHPTETPVDKQQ